MGQGMRKRGEGICLKPWGKGTCPNPASKRPLKQNQTKTDGQIDDEKDPEQRQL